jgi:hypothetical protein
MPRITVIMFRKKVYGMTRAPRGAHVVHLLDDKLESIVRMAKSLVQIPSKLLIKILLSDLASFLYKTIKNNLTSVGEHACLSLSANNTH